MSLPSLDFLLQQAENCESKNDTKTYRKIDLQTPFGLNDLMFDDNEVYSSDNDIASNMSMLHLESQMTEECSNISDYINKHLSLLPSDECKFNSNETSKNTELEHKSFDLLKNESRITPTILKLKRDTLIKKHKLFTTKPLAMIRKSPLQNQDSGCSMVMGRIYPISKSNSLNDYLYNVLVDTRRQGFKFNTPAPDELVLSWMDIVRQMPSK
ncbi:uncharacterized protein LOC126834563 [Adelges cooleyi]|uniref:uncharacterized protein LOC126834563 n=1 Tax=Adelges cooleyi TaxID=133065 RepID=UPI0021806740|nr:uncharacterized protein LOC126834563 [Adelges cooleyi]XP_050422544.1 uncharacterized protein LOC126834563 [Adelges cooleyi]XP_050422545.1 uncharacterized protein LOC126834563 [Adelges cooleyi]